ncbi:hypothetical protein niasHT_036162 [Heterodera trifolii]|uniref:Nucleotide-diphospho-sugar transferase domain-containing protein n=1 Tax=Heterodera trifolii TaxID=157864 RepID=A0ABD2IFZ4_9BILA
MFNFKLFYTLKMNESCSIRGKKFNCSLAWLLERYKLSDKYTIEANTEVKFPGDPKFVFATAASANYFPSLRLLIAKIKEHFGCTQKIIAYDLGNVTKNSEMMAELNSVCELEWRIFDFSQMVEGRVRHPKSFAWKILAMAEVLSEYDTVAWVDTSVLFSSDNLEPILTQIQNGKIGPVQLLTTTWHGKNIATHPRMYDYLPMVANFGPTKQTNDLSGKEEPPQFESKFVILHKTESTRQMMKWLGGDATFAALTFAALTLAAQTFAAPSQSDTCGADTCGEDICGADICGATLAAPTDAAPSQKDICGADTCGAQSK